MSADALTAVMYAEVEPLDKLILLILADAGDGGGDLVLRCSPEYVERITGIPSEEIVRRVYRLAADGTVEVGPREGDKLVVDVRGLRKRP